jgi:hypothetical protein
MKRQKLELSLTQAEDLLRLPPVFQGSIGFQPVSCTERATTLRHDHGVADFPRAMRSDRSACRRSLLALLSFEEGKARTLRLHRGSAGKIL